MKSYSVWVGGGEVNPGYLKEEDAERIANAWRSMGYEDVIVEEVSER